MLDTGQVIDGIFAAASTGDLGEVMSWWAADGVLEDVTLAQAFTGTAEIREYLEMYFGALLPDVRYEPIRVVISGPTAVVEWARRGRCQAVRRRRGLSRSGDFHARARHVPDRRGPRSA